MARQQFESPREFADLICFVGDGINDAPVLSRSDCGIAMGLGAEAAIEAADTVLASGDLTALPKAVCLAKRTMRTVRGNITFALAVKAAVIVLAFFGLAQMWMSVLADTGVCVICVLNAARLLKQRRCHDGAGRLLIKSYKQNLPSTARSNAGVGGRFC